MLDDEVYPAHADNPEDAAEAAAALAATRGTHPTEGLAGTLPGRYVDKLRDGLPPGGSDAQRDHDARDLVRRSALSAVTRGMSKSMWLDVVTRAPALMFHALHANGRGRQRERLAVYELLDRIWAAAEVRAAESPAWTRDAGDPDLAADVAARADAVDALLADARCKLGPAQRAVLGYAADQARAVGSTAVNLPRIPTGEALDIHERSVRRVLAQLVGMGLLDLVDAGRGSPIKEKRRAKCFGLPVVAGPRQYLTGSADRLARAAARPQVGGRQVGAGSSGRQVGAGSTPPERSRQVGAGTPGRQVGAGTSAPAPDRTAQLAALAAQPAPPRTPRPPRMDYGPAAALPPAAAPPAAERPWDDPAPPQEQPWDDPAPVPSEQPWDSPTALPEEAELRPAAAPTAAAVAATATPTAEAEYLAAMMGSWMGSVRPAPYVPRAPRKRRRGTS